MLLGTGTASGTCMQGVLGCIVVNKDGVILKTTCEVFVLHKGTCSTAIPMRTKIVKYKCSQKSLSFTHT